MERAISTSLKALRREFLRAADRYPDLFHELLVYDENSVTIHTDGSEFDGWTDEDYQTKPWCVGYSPSDLWKPFIEATANRETKPSWEEWGIQDFNECGRFFGCQNGLDEFRRLGESLAIVFGEIDPAFRLPFGATGPVYRYYTNYEYALAGIHSLAESYPTPLLRLKHRMWDFLDGPLDEALWHMWSKPNRGETVYPLHPSCLQLAHNVFTSAVAAIDLLLAPGSALILDPPKESPRLIAAMRARQAKQKKQEAADTEPLDEKAPYVFLRKVEYWILRYAVDDGPQEEGHYEDQPGFEEYARLLSQPDKVIDSVALDPLPRPEESSGQLVADEATNEQLKKKISELNDELEIVKDTDNPARIEEIYAKLQDLKKYENQIGYKGKHKKFKPNNAKAAHQAIRTRFCRIKKTIAGKMPHLAAYLTETVKTVAGPGWRYRPIKPIQWVLLPE